MIIPCLAIFILAACGNPSGPSSVWQGIWVLDRGYLSWENICGLTAATVAAVVPAEDTLELQSGGDARSVQWRYSSCNEPYADRIELQTGWEVRTTELEVIHVEAYGGTWRPLGSDTLCMTWSLQDPSICDGIWRRVD